MAVVDNRLGDLYAALDFFSVGLVISRVLVFDCRGLCGPIPFDEFEHTTTIRVTFAAKELHIVFYCGRHACAFCLCAACRSLAYRQLRGLP